MIQDLFLRRVVYLFGTIALAFGFAILMASIVRYRPYGVPEGRMDEYKEILARQEKLRQVSQEAKKTSLSPKAFCGEQIHDFGSVDPHSSVNHTFVIANRGTAPLQLTPGETSCKCTLSDAREEWIAPGESTEITLTYNSGNVKKDYQQTAKIYTNDPTNPEIVLAVKGSVRQILACSDDEIVFSDAVEGQKLEREVQIYSQVWSEFSLESISCDSPEVAWKIRPLDENELEAVGAQSGWGVTISQVVPDQTQYFSSVVQFHISTDPSLEKETENITSEGSESEPVDDRTLQLPVRGNIVRRLSLKGPLSILHQTDGIRWGVVKPGTELRLMIQIRGEPPKRLEIAQVQPSFVQAEIERSERANLAVLILRIPEDTAPTVFDGPTAGFVLISSDVLPTGTLKVPLRGVVSNMAKDGSDKKEESND